MARREPQPSTVLRVAAAWGTTVLSVKYLVAGESYVLGDGLDATMIMPEGLFASKNPVRAVSSGWELDAHGVSNGLLRLRGREEDPTRISAEPIPLVPGDWGLLQYGAFSIFFQFAHAPPPLVEKRPYDTLLRLALASSLVLHVALFASMRVLTIPSRLPKPNELSRPEEIAARFGVRRAFFVEPAPAPESDRASAAADESGASDVHTPRGDHHKGERKGRLGNLDNGGKKDGETSGEIRGGPGALRELWASETGEQVRHALGAISSVAPALGGLGVQELVLGAGSAAALKNGGIAFGSATLNTGAALQSVSISAGSGSASGGLSDEPIRQVVTAASGAFRDCFESDPNRSPSLKGGVTMKWQIGPDGNVAAATIASSTLGNAKVEGCLLRQVKGWKFPSSGAPSNVEWPFKFVLE